MAYFIGLPNDKNAGNDEPAIWINPDHIVQLTPLIDGAPDARRLIVELKLIGLPIIRSYFGTFASTQELDARWLRLLSELEHPSAEPDIRDAAPGSVPSPMPSGETA